MTRKTVLIATLGSLGDLHPFIAIGSALKDRGAKVLMAVPASHVSKVEASGLEARAIMPDHDAVRSELGMTEAEFARRVMTSPDFLIKQIILRSLADSTRALDQIAAEADIVFGSIYALSAQIVCQKRSIPYVPGLLQPLAFQSAVDPPRTPDFRMMARYPARGLALSWNRIWQSVIFAEVKRRYSGPVNAVRAEHGLGPLKNAPVFALETEPKLRLALYSRKLGPDDPVRVAGAQFTGFPLFDSNSGRQERLDQDLEVFLNGGEPPVVFTLGSFAVYASGAFYEHSAEACRRMGLRAIFLTGRSQNAQTTGPTLTRSYLPHSLVFSRCAAIVHHGGIGTTGQAMMAGRPQVVVPHMGDQWDNGYRLERLGVATVVPARDYTAKSARRVITEILDNQALSERAEHVARDVRLESGAATAAERILSALH